MLNGRIFSVFIASPNDATELRKIAFDVITDWNNQHSTALRVALLPKMWETGTAPGKESAQEIINRDALDGADLVIAIWRYLWGAGTEEEVERSIHDDSREVMQYFSVEPVPRDYLTNPRQQRLQSYQEKMNSEGEPYYWTYKNPEDFRKILTRHLEFKVNQMMSKTKQLDVSDFSQAELNILAYAVNSLKIVYGTDEKSGDFKVKTYSSPSFVYSFPGDGAGTSDQYRQAVSDLFAKGVLVSAENKTEMNPDGGTCFINHAKRDEVEKVIRKIV